MNLTPVGTILDRAITYSSYSTVLASWGVRTAQRWVTVYANVAYTTITTNMNNTVVGSSYIPYMRSKDIIATVTGLRPFTRVYPFFDDVRIDNFVQPYSPQNGLYTSLGGALITSAAGEIKFKFKLPSDSVNKFAIGSKRLSVVDTISPSTEDVTTNAESVYTSMGELQTRQRTISIDNNTRISNNVVIGGYRVDPIAQSFFIEKETGGVFVTSIGVFFKTKDANIPIQCVIREMDPGGQPTMTYVAPWAVALLPAASVNVSNDASLETVFTFDRPVHLNDDKDYCFALISNSNKYLAWIATIGDNEVDSTKSIAKNAAAGVLFMSQNNVTWTADQYSDMKFKIYKAVFPVVSFGANNHGILPFVNKTNPTLKIDAGAITTVSGSAIVTIDLFGHGFTYDPLITNYLTFSNVTAGTYNGITSANIIGKRLITYAGINSFKFTAGSVASSSGVVSIPSMTIDKNIPYDVSKINVEVENLPGVSTFYEQKTTSGKAFDGTQVGFVKETNWTMVELDQNIEYFTPRVVASETNKNEATTMNGANSVDFRINLQTTNPNISPFINVANPGMVVSANQVDDPKVFSGAGMITSVGSVPRTLAMNLNSLTLTPVVGMSIAGCGLPVGAVISSILTGATYTASIAGTTLTTSGAFLTGTAIYVGASVTGANIAPGTYITGQLTGTANASGGATYSVNISQTVVSTTFSNGSSFVTSADGIPAIMGTASFSNKLNWVPETHPGLGSIGTKYVHYPVTLTNPATSLRYIFDANIFEAPAGIGADPTIGASNIDLYYKIANSGTELVNLEWIKVDTSNQVKSSNKVDFLEYNYEVKGLAPFSVFVTKVVYRSTNSAMAPTVANYRVIALAV